MHRPRQRHAARGISWLATGLVVLGATAAPGAQAATTLVGVDADWRVPLDVAGMLENNSVTPDFAPEFTFEVGNQTITVPGPDVENCPGPYMEFDVEGGSFTFEEGMFETGCAEAQLNVTPPPGAASLQVKFTADRVIRHGADGTQFPVVAPQELRVYASGDETPQRVAYFPESDGTMPLTAFTFSFTLGRDGPVRLGWYFEEKGYSAVPTVPSPGGGQSFNATVRDLALHYVAVPFPGSRETELPALPAGANQTIPIVVSTNLTAPLVTQLEEMRLWLDAAAAFDGLEAPDGHVHGSDVPQRIERGVRIVSLDQALVASHGPGDYRLLMSRTVPAPPPLPLPGPFSLAPWSVLFMALPIVAGIAATGSTGYALVRHRSAPATAVRVLFATAILLSMYVAVLVLYAAWGPTPTDVEYLPLSPAGVSIYLQLGLLFVLLVALAVLGASERRAARREAEEARVRKAYQADLERSNRELEHYAALASHDLQEPMRKVALFTQMIRDRYRGHLDSTADVYLDHAADAAIRMQRLIRDLLSYSRVGHDKVPSRAVVMEDVMRRVRDEMSRILRRTRGRLTWDRLPTVHGDPNLLQQLLRNLVENAVKYRDPARRPRVHVGARETAAAWTLSVRDNGIGIEAKDAPHIFQLFRRLHPRTEYEGTGIGLALCRKIAELHGGAITLESTPGVGSTFHVTLPKQAKEMRP